MKKNVSKGNTRVIYSSSSQKKQPVQKKKKSGCGCGKKYKLS